MVGAGKAEGSMDAGNMLKPALARGELHCVGATTLDEYRKYVEKDAALERRFQKVMVNEPTRGGHHRDPARPQGTLRGASRRRHHRPGHRRRGHAFASLHRRPPAARQGHRPDRRSRLAHPHGDRLQAGGDGPARPAHHPAQDRARGAEEGEGRGFAKAAARISRIRTRGAGKGIRRSRGGLEGGKGLGAGRSTHQGGARSRAQRTRDGAARPGSGAHVARSSTARFRSSRSVSPRRPPTGRRATACCAIASPRRKWPRSSPSGRASRCRRCSRASARSCCAWKR